MGWAEKGSIYFLLGKTHSTVWAEKNYTSYAKKNPFELPCLALTRNVPSSLVTVSAFQSVADLGQYTDEEVILHRNDKPPTFFHVYDSPIVLAKRLKV